MTFRPPVSFLFCSALLLGCLLILTGCGDETGGIDDYQIRTADADGEDVKLRLFFFDGTTHSLVVVDQGDEPKTRPRHQGLREAMQSNNCVAGVNASYFHPDFRPLGLAVADGERLNQFANSSLLSGVVVSRGKEKHLQILRRGEFVDGKDVDQLVQAGPFLVDQGAVVEGLSSSKKAPRTFMLTDGEEEFALGYTSSSVTLAGLAKVLADPAVIPEFKVARALNLDGGSSSCFWVKTGESDDSYFRPLKPVRNFIGVRERKKLKASRDL